MTAGQWTQLMVLVYNVPFKCCYAKLYLQVIKKEEKYSFDKRLPTFSI